MIRYLAWTWVPREFSLFLPEAAVGGLRAVLAFPAIAFGHRTRGTPVECLDSYSEFWDLSSLCPQQETDEPRVTWLEAIRRVCYRDLRREDHLFRPALSLCWTFLLKSATLFVSAKKARVLLLMLRCSHFALFSFPSRAFDRNSNGTIDFHEFQGLHGFLINMQNSFTHFDMDRSGKLTVEEVQRAVEHAGIATTLSISQELQCLSPDFKWLVSWSVKISEDKKLYDGLSIMQGFWILPAVFCKDIWRKPFTINTFLTTLLIDVSVSDIYILQQDTLGFDVFEFFCHAPGLDPALPSKYLLPLHTQSRC